MRIGIGYDAHRFAKGRRLVLGGVEIAHEQGLEAYSDGDVIIHSIMDALLGAAGLDDIGKHFPPGDPQYRDISSLELLKRVVALIEQAGYRIGNIDVAVMAEQPKLSPHVAMMKAQIGQAAGIAATAIGIKATTNEKMGFVGRGEGIAAQAVALLE
jgi:2-C-methyl-D-erythritol 2,4-cyclodiphosphate synthase